MSRYTLSKYTPRVMALLLSLVLILSCVPVVQAAESGTCGNDLTWTFSDGLLTISGSGAMQNYDEWNLPPWYSFRRDIQRLSLPEEMTRVGNMAFYDCVNLTAVSVPSTVTDIGELAFCQNRSMTMLTLNSGLKTIGRSAFERCESLLDLRIPGTVTTIGNDAFYMCMSLTYVTVPSSVTSMGSGVFAYCYDLVRADVEASMKDLPFWTFYGCDNLNSASFGGDSLDTEYLKNETSSNDVNGQPPVLPPQVQPPEQEQNETQNKNTATSVNATQNQDGSAELNNTTVTKTENTTITKTENTTVSGSDGEISTSTDITASVVNPEGWNEVVEQIQSAQKNDPTGQDPKIDADIYVTGESTVPEEVLKELAGTNVEMNITTQSGSQFRIDCAELNKDQISGGLDLSYTVTLAETFPSEFDGLTVYHLKFHNSSSVKVEVMIRLPLVNVRKSASLYQTDREGKPELLQAVVVDDSGYSHYYLSSIDSGMEYLIAIDVPGEQTSQAIVPDTLYEDYKLVDQESGIEYVVTGRSSSWGMNLGQVMGILAVVMVSVIVIVGVVMYIINKRRLKAGYVPQWDDEDEE